MKSVWIDECLSPRSARSAGVSPRAGKRLRDRRAERDVAGRVLVEERVVEGDPRPPDAGLAVDERDLAEPDAAFVSGDVRAHHLGAGGGVDLDRLAVLEADLEIAHDRAAEHQRPRRPHRPLCPARVGGAVHLLGRHVGDELDPVHRVVESRRGSCLPGAGRPSGRCPGRGTGASRSAGDSGRPRVPKDEPCAPATPRRDPARRAAPMSRAPPRAARRRARRNRLGPPGVRKRDDRPVDLVVVGRAQHRLGHVLLARHADAAAVQVGEQLGLRGTGDRDVRGVTFAVCRRTLDRPAREKPSDSSGAPSIWARRTCGSL